MCLYRLSLALDIALHAQANASTAQSEDWAAFGDSGSKQSAQAPPVSSSLDDYADYGADDTATNDNFADFGNANQDSSSGGFADFGSSEAASGGNAAGDDAFADFNDFGSALQDAISEQQTQPLDDAFSGFDAFGDDTPASGV